MLHVFALIITSLLKIVLDRCTSENMQVEVYEVKAVNTFFSWEQKLV